MKKESSCKNSIRSPRDLNVYFSNKRILLTSCRKKLRDKAKSSRLSTTTWFLHIHIYISFCWWHLIPINSYAWSIRFGWILLHIKNGHMEGLEENRLLLKAIPKMTSCSYLKSLCFCHQNFEKSQAY